MPRPTWLLGLMLLLVVSSVLTACGSNAAPSEHAHLPLAPAEAMPAEVQQAPARVQEAYRLAVANPTVFTQVPCYCGCDKLGHQDNYECYVAEAYAAGTFDYDAHALGCQICIDITHDTARLWAEGRSIGEIQAEIDALYARYGPPTTHE